MGKTITYNAREAVAKFNAKLASRNIYESPNIPNSTAAHITLYNKEQLLHHIRTKTGNSKVNEYYTFNKGVTVTRMR